MDWIRWAAVAATVAFGVLAGFVAGDLWGFARGRRHECEAWRLRLRAGRET